jgi:hypothetical protein
VAAAEVYMPLHLKSHSGRAANSNCIFAADDAFDVSFVAFALLTCCFALLL